MSMETEMSRENNIAHAVYRVGLPPEFNPAWLTASPSRKADPDALAVPQARSKVWMGAVAAVGTVSLGLGVFFFQNRAPQTVPSRALVMSVRGQVNVERAGTAVAVHTGDILVEADRIETGADSVLDLAVSGHAIRIMGQSSASIAELRRNPDGSAKSVRMRLDKGGLLSVAGRLSGPDKFEVQTPTAIAGVRGTRFLVQTDEQGTRVRLFQGSVMVQANGQERILESGSAVRVTSEKMESAGPEETSYLVDFNELEANPDLRDPEILQAAEALQSARTAEEIKKLYQKIEIIRLRDGREFRGVIASQTGSRVIIHTPEGIYIVDKGELELVDLVEEQQ